MASTPAVPHNGQNGRTKLPNPTILEKKTLGLVRRSTPDSEALASSDDEQNQAMSMSLHSVKSLPPQGPPRRPSWLSEVQSSNKPRKFSLGGASYASSVGSQPTTPSAENGPWEGGATLSRTGTNGSGSYPWTPQGWQKDRSRLMEVMPSPGPQYEDMRSPTFQHQMPHAGLPFEIPLEPSRKTVRSQSYSAGQLENMSSSENAAPGGFSRTKPGLLHRPSRPSMLGDGGRDILGSLREDEDDVDVGSSNGSDRAHQQQSVAPRFGAGRGVPLMNRTSATSPLQQSGPFRNNPRSSATFPLSPGSDYAVADDVDENADNLSEIGRIMARGVVSSTASTITNTPSMATALENRRLEGLKRSQWQSSLGFGIIEEGSQSRRHSFAELPSSRTRSSPMTAQSELLHSNPYQGYNLGPPGYVSLLDNNNSETFHRDQSAEERKLTSFNSFNPHQQLFYRALVRLHRTEEDIIIRAQTNDKNYAASYFSGVEAQRRHIRDPPSNDYNPFAVPNVFHSRPSKILYLVAFKCNRADIYYIPENTGLQVKAGDTVIVEGDRGQDLGTVERVNITMDQAKQLKEDYTQKHFRCLMMFSRLYPHIAALAGDDQAFANSISDTNAILPGNAAAGPNFARDTSAQFEPEPRPKMIKRVARPDEVHLLREKEGNEAKAKRVCQTKVNDHGLRMEILDAEFQHDYRKLTFFYYAEEYINFNELVTDLFKVYKTRIWMSAINPSTYMAMNPNTAPRPPQFSKPGHSNHAATYLRAQEDFRTAIEGGGRTASPIDRDGPAARGNREFERVMQMQSSARDLNMGHSDVAPVMPGAPSSEDFASGIPSFYARRSANPTYPPNGNLAAYTSQYGANAPMTGQWPQNGNQQQYPFYPNHRDIAGNYAISPAMAPPTPMNQQATAFTPRAQQQFSGYPSTVEPDLQKLLNEQFQRFTIDPTRRT